MWRRVETGAAAGPRDLTPDRGGRAGRPAPHFRLARRGRTLPFHPPDWRLPCSDASSS
jgi:hypothetical protein